MITSAGVTAPVVIAIICGGIAGGFAYEYRKIRRARKRRSRAPGAPVRRDAVRLSKRRICRVLAAYERDFRRGTYAKEPRRARRQP